MKPVLYDKDAFSQVESEKTAAVLPASKIGVLGDTVSCIVSESNAGEQTMELSYPANGPFAKQLCPEAVLCVETGSGGEFRQFFRIYDVRRSFSVVEVSAEHISYWLNCFLVPPMKFTPAENVSTDVIVSHMHANVILPRGINSLPFLIHNDISAQKNANDLEGFTEPFTVRSGLQMIQEQFGLPVIYGNFHVYIQEVDGVTNIKKGRNLTEFQQELDLADIVTGCVAYYQYENVFTKSAAIHYTSLPCGSLGYDRVVWADCSSQFQYEPDLGVLSDAAAAYMRQHEKVELDKNLTVSVAPDEDGRKLRLFNKVKVIYPEWEISEEAVVVKTEYDVLAGRFTAYELGKRALDISDAINVMNRRMKKA